MVRFLHVHHLSGKLSLRKRKTCSQQERNQPRSAHHHSKHVILPELDKLADLIARGKQQRGESITEVDTQPTVSRGVSSQEPKAKSQELRA
jgi:hypothetical protein